jgi:hypothetical protein
VSVSISGNYLIVGANKDAVGANTAQGSVSIFQYNGSSWVLMQKITDATGALGDNFGFSVSISGNNAIVGAYLDDVGANTDQGSVSIYKYNGSTWVLQSKLTDPSGQNSDHFGFSVSISGNNAIVGSPDKDFFPLGVTNNGYAIMYNFNGSNWVFGWETFISNYAADNDQFGFCVAISGNNVIVGAPGRKAALISTILSGSAFAYNLAGTLLCEMINTAGIIPLFGSSVSVSGNYAMVGSPGITAIFAKLGMAWQPLQKVKDPAALNADRFGAAVSVDGSTKQFIIGAPDYAYPNYSGKAVFGKIN